MDTRKLILIAAVVFALALLPVAITGAPAIAQAAAGTAEPAPTAQASVVSTKNVVPARKKVVHRKFRPWAKPSQRKVREIIRNEARRWRISAASLTRRAHCESRLNWWASNGLYHGVLQFAPSTFYRGVSSIRTRKVTLVRTKIRRVNVVRVSRYSDGRTERRRTTPRRQKLVVVYHGKLPRNPSVTNAWAQLRIGAQAIRGISAVRSSEWGCPA
jgi:hypothetical protein